MSRSHCYLHFWFHCYWRTHTFFYNLSLTSTANVSQQRGKEHVGNVKEVTFFFNLGIYYANLLAKSREVVDSVKACKEQHGMYNICMDVKEMASKGGTERWKNVPKEERSEHMRQLQKRSVEARKKNRVNDSTDSE